MGVGNKVIGVIIVRVLRRGRYDYIEVSRYIRIRAINVMLPGFKRY